MSHPSLIAAKAYAMELAAGNLKQNPVEPHHPYKSPAAFEKYNAAREREIANEPERLYDVWVINDKTGVEEKQTSYPMTHNKCLVMRSKMTSYPWRRIVFREAVSVKGENPRRRNPVPEGNRAKVAKAKRRYESFRDQKSTGAYEIEAPDYARGAKPVGWCSAIDYTTFRGEENNKEKYRHDFKKECAPVVMRASSGHYWSSGGRFRFTYRGFMDRPSMESTCAGEPPFPVGMVVGYLDALYIVQNRVEKKINFVGKKVLLCVSESGYNFFTVKEP